MEYTSFYGGRRGASFIIVKSFPSVADMVAAFSQGGAYKTVGYDEYVLIDTEDKNDIDNGKIYRRGYEYNNETGGAIYIGQIVGPDGAAPQVEMKTYKEVEDIYDARGPIDPETGDEYRKTSGEYAPKENLVQGSWVEDGERKYNDSIKWVACSIRDAHSNSSTVHVGFIIPYMVVDYTAKSVDPYFHRSNETDKFDNERLVYREDDGQHPYYESWHLDIPKGIKGDTLKNLRVTTVAECNEEHPGWLQQYAGMDDDQITEAIKKERKIFVYDYYHYDKDGEGEPVSIYLGDYNSITDVRLDDNGTLTIDYSHDDEEVWDRVFKWITSVQLDTETGHFSIEFNHDTDVNGEPTIYETDLRWVKDIEFKEDGSVNLKYTTNTDQGLEYDRLIKWIKEVGLDPETGKFTIDFNYAETPDGEPTHYEQDLRWLKGIDITDTGTVHFDYTCGEDPTLYNKFKWIKDIKVDPETGHFTVIYNYDADPITQEPTIYETDLRWVKDIRVDNEGTVLFDYTYGNDFTLTKLIKWVKSVSLNSETGEFQMEFNHLTDRDGNPTTYTTQLRWVNGLEIADDGTVTLKYTQGEDVVLDKTLKWIDNVALNPDGTLTFTYNDGSTKVFENELQWINDIEFTDEGHFSITFNNGKEPIEKDLTWLTDLKIDTGETEGEGTQKVEATWNNGNKTFIGNPINYIMKTAIDERFHSLVLYSDPARRQVIKDSHENATYDGRDDWHDLGYIGNGTGVGAIAGKESDPAVQAVAETMPPYSAWFIIEEE